MTTLKNMFQHFSSGTDQVNNWVLLIGDSAKLIQNSTYPIVSINPTGRFDCTSTDGS